MRVAGLAFRGRAENGRNIVVAFDVRFLCEIQVAAVGLRFTCECFFKVVFGFAAFQ